MDHLHIGLAAIGAAPAVGGIVHEGIWRRWAAILALRTCDGAVDSRHRVRGSDRLCHAVPRSEARVAIVP